MSHNQLGSAGPETKTPTPEELGTQMHELVTQLHATAPDSRYVDVIGGTPDRSSHFSYHYRVGPARDPESGELTGGVSIVEVVNKEVGQIRGYKLEDIQPGIAPQRGAPEGTGNEAKMVTSPAPNYELAYVLDRLKSGKVIDPTKFVVVNKSPDPNKNNSIRRVYKKGGLRHLGRRALDKYTWE